MTAHSSTHTFSHMKRLWIAALLLLSTVLFVVGIVAERSSGESPPIAAPQAMAATALPEGSAEKEAQEGQTTATQASGEGSAAHEAAEQNRVFGLDIEAPWFIASVLIGTLLLIVALFRFGAQALPWVLLVTIGAALFDGREVVSQLGRAHYGIAALAGVIVASRLATAVLAWLALREAQRDAGPPMPSGSMVS